MTVRDFVFAAAAVVAAAGCYATTSGYYPTSYAYVEPPPSRDESAVHRPGYVWVHGHWVRDGGWRWQPGYFEHSRPGYIWVDGHWAALNGRWVWIRGGWYTRGGFAGPA
jgi:hypothetical protein